MVSFDSSHGQAQDDEKNVLLLFFPDIESSMDVSVRSNRSSYESSVSVIFIICVCVFSAISQCRGEL